MNWRPLQLKHKLCLKFLLLGVIIILITLSSSVWHQFQKLSVASQQPVDTFFVLGGSILREMYVAELAKQNPQIPILISTGSDDPCILKLFEREQAQTQQVWLEKCANSTFDNFFYSQPILSKWQAHHVKLITSPTHLPRAKWMAQIMLGSHGIWVDVETVKETGVPANRELWLKTGMDVTRTFLWALASQVIQPSCSNLTQLEEVNLKKWCQEKFSCEYQSGIDSKSICQEKQP
ncbi:MULTISPECIES: YdcF family protein [Planktothrix]|jgi:uncharacterized SAM-binding protein YcdF (DUF218 family)|uniref:DUF218 domain-containing protein n=2 Tax=Planktothrix TaxID=54304 RepID=A0A4P5ZD21_PLAAG|nr:MULTISPECIES: YdcF family protein [Planktothrix]CAD5922173.1 hypothetical protein NO108_01113 [Planktothrix rubescens]CAC5340259.1 conserved hypothetical protein [Planktothrix rubescens NIVA-CYA 18]CAD5944857.1 hypothetical protein PCC7821_02149 [Planktothrix rubescens NIVA-CYA 18]CAH2572702.1 hypothetical protein PRNO82_02109 [Planktothrix rubescens]GDZ93920.1 protein of unknown function DUF218 [Planktothrix agardhii CCAP 1459/11A]